MRVAIARVVRPLLFALVLLLSCRETMPDSPPKQPGDMPVPELSPPSSDATDGGK